MIALLPPFINSQAPIAPQLFWLISIIMISEFVCMTIYATGGKGLKRALGHTNNVRLMNRISATLMLAVAVWLLLG